MTLQAVRAPAPPVGVVDSLARGFEAVNSRLWLVLLPLTLDVFLWLGPRLSIERLLQRLSGLFPADLVSDPLFQRDLQEVLAQIVQAGGRFNLFSSLSTTPLGLPSLMAGRTPLANPFGLMLVVPVSSLAVYGLILLTLALTGLFLGALYFDLAAGPLRESRTSLGEWLRQVLRQWSRFLTLAVLALGAALILGIPLVLAIAFLGLLSPVLAQVIFVLAMTILLWALLYISFTPHGVVLGGQGVFSAAWDSIRMVQWNLPAAAGLFCVMVALSWGLNYVWNLPGDDSWYLLLGAAGHAYVGTGLLAASFVFYKDRRRWWQEARAQLIARAHAERHGAGDKP